MKLTTFERSWLTVFGVLSVVILAILLIQPHLKSLTHSEPLADPKSLALLMAGKELPIPKDALSGQFHGHTVTPPSLASLSAPTTVLGDSVADKHIDVDLANQKVYAYEGSTKIYTFVVSTGKWGPTPTGDFHIWSKVRSQTMSGGDMALGTYYFLPNIPYVMFFYNDEVDKSRGFSFHGTYWHNNFGHPMSHGCVNMRSSDAKLLYEWATPVVTNDKAWSTLATKENPGTLVHIFGTPPEE